MKNQIKYLQNIFYDLLNDYGKVFIVVKYSEKTVIGTRGFTAQEKEKGIILVFNKDNYKKLKWTEDGSIVAALHFGRNNRPENCFLHYDDIIAVYSPEAMVKIDRWDILNKEYDYKQGKKTPEVKKEKIIDRKVISIDKYRNKTEKDL